jgi:hypothetical protein
MSSFVFSRCISTILLLLNTFPSFRFFLAYFGYFIKELHVYYINMYSLSNHVVLCRVSGAGGDLPATSSQRVEFLLYSCAAVLFKKAATNRFYRGRL